MVGLAWSTTFGTWEPKLGGTGTRGMDRGGQDGSGQAKGHGESYWHLGIRARWIMYTVVLRYIWREPVTEADEDCSNK